MRPSVLVRSLITSAAMLLTMGSVHPVGAAPAAQSAADPKTLVVGAAFDIKSLDPARGFEQIGGMVHKATYNTLVTLDETDISHIVPDLDPAFISRGRFAVFAVLDSKTVQAHGGTNAPNAAAADTAEQWLNQNSAGTGPFIMTRYTPDTEVDVQKFAGYWNGDAPFDR